MNTMDADPLTVALIIYFGVAVISFLKLTGDYKDGTKEALIHSILWPIIVVALPLLLIVLSILNAVSRLSMAGRKR